MTSYFISNDELIINEVTTFQLMAVAEAGILHNEILKHNLYIKGEHWRYKSCFVIPEISPHIMELREGLEELIRAKVIGIPKTFRFTESVIYRYNPYPDVAKVEPQQHSLRCRYVVVTVMLKNSGEMYVNHSYENRRTKVETNIGTIIVLHAAGLYDHPRAPTYEIENIITDREVLVFSSKM